MKTVILYRSDFRNDELGMSFDGLLDALGIDTHELVDGKYIDRELDMVEITVAGSKAE